MEQIKVENRRVPISEQVEEAFTFLVGSGFELLRQGETANELKLRMERRNAIYATLLWVEANSDTIKAAHKMLTAK